jgi:hypothetical protein
MGNIKLTDDEQGMIIRLLGLEILARQKRIQKVHQGKKSRDWFGDVETPAEKTYRENAIRNAENQIQICWNAIEKIKEGQNV